MNMPVETLSDPLAAHARAMLEEVESGVRLLSVDAQRDARKLPEERSNALKLWP